MVFDLIQIARSGNMQLLEDTLTACFAAVRREERERCAQWIRATADADREVVEWDRATSTAWVCAHRIADALLSEPYQEDN